MEFARQSLFPPIERQLQTRKMPTRRDPLLWACLLGFSLRGECSILSPDQNRDLPLHAELYSSILLLALLHGLYLPLNEPDMDIIPLTLKNGRIIVDYSDGCAINDTRDELTDNINNLLPKEFKGRYGIALVHGCETFPPSLDAELPSMFSSAAFLTFVS